MNTRPRITSLGSADPNFMQAIETKPAPIQGQANQLAQTVADPNMVQKGPAPLGKLEGMYEPVPMNSNLNAFASYFTKDFKGKLENNPQMQAALFDFDNSIKANAGVFRKKEDGLKEIGTDHDGQPLYAAPHFMQPDNSNDFKSGQVQLQGIGGVLDGIGAFKNKAEADSFLQKFNASGDPKFMGEVQGWINKGDKTSALNKVLSGIGAKTIDQIDPEKADPATLATAFAAHNLIENWDSLNHNQRSMAMAGMSLGAFQFSDGKLLNQRTLIDKNSANGPDFTVGDALAFAGQGVNVPSLMKNWDQIDAIQRITFGAGTSSQLVATAQRLSLLGAADAEGAAVKSDPAQLARAGFRPVPSAGPGAIVGPASVIPEGYEAVSAGTKPDTVVAVPKGLSSMTAIGNGSTQITSLNADDGVKPAGQGAFNVHKNWVKTSEVKPNGVVGGSSFAAGLNKSGLTTDPYVAGALVANSVHGNTIAQKSSQDVNNPFNQMGVNATVKPQQKGPSKSDQNLNAAIGTTRTMVNTMAKFGNDYAQAGAPYVNAVAAGKQLYDVLNNPNATDKQKAEAVASAAQSGTQVAAAMGSETAGSVVPYLNYAMAAYNASKILTGDMTNEQKAVALRRTAEDTAAAYYTFGLSAVAQYADRQFFGGQGDKLRTKMDKIDPGKIVADKLLTKTLDATDSAFGGKGKDQVGRDKVRSNLKKLSIANDQFQVTLADGTTADIGTDGHGGQHEFRFKDKAVDEVRALNSYDVDYTNDLDFSSNMMTSALVRLTMGGKGKAIDQVAGQLGNAALGKIGFGQDMTEDNFKSIQANARGFFAQSGIKTKEDGYALLNQMMAENRITEIDSVAIQQGINMAFNENGFDVASQLMSGRWKGLQVSAETPSAPGPNIDIVSKQPAPVTNLGGLMSAVTQGEAPTEESVDAEEFVLNMGNYGGPATSGALNYEMQKASNPNSPNPEYEQWLAKIKAKGIQW